MANRLARESSPYLQQHAQNPVDWYPWGTEALERARAEDRPILLSVGYSSCHWCHVMAHESFEDPSTAGLMNELFVNIKVDREERPDIDQIYMKAVQAMTGRGGWPMTVFLTPDQVPFFGGTYYPPEPRPGMPSFSEVLRSVADAWENRREDVAAGSERLLEALSRATVGPSPRSADVEALDEAFQALRGRFDPEHGGFGRAPKFPQPVTLELLMRHHLRTGGREGLEMAVHTLRRMAAGGVRDHLGGGFHRYSVDERWLVPHFEKMLYDNALLASAYLDAYRLTGSDDLKAVAVETLEYLERDLRAPHGGFFSARDADSEGEEGTFYVWEPEEVETVLGRDAARLFSRTYDVSDGGNFEGKNILHLPHDLPAIAQSEGLSEAELEGKLAHSRKALLERRESREAPFRDEKTIVAWNGLAIRAFAEAGAALARWDFVDVATGAADFIWSTMRSEDGLLHSSMNGEAKIGGFLDDHAALGNAFLSLHGATLERRWLDSAAWLCEQILDRFWDEEAGTVFDSAADAEALILRPRDPMDNATPSGPSLAAELLARTGRIVDDARYLDAARRIVDHEAEGLARFGPAFGRMLSVLDRLLAAPVEIVIVGGDDDETRALATAAHSEVLSDVVVAGLRDGEPDDIPLLQGRRRLNGKPAAYVCRSYACGLPAADPATLEEELHRINAPAPG